MSWDILEDRLFVSRLIHNFVIEFMSMIIRELRGISDEINRIN